MSGAWRAGCDCGLGESCGICVAGSSCGCWDGGTCAACKIRYTEESAVRAEVWGSEHAGLTWRGGLYAAGCLIGPVPYWAWEGHFRARIGYGRPDPAVAVQLRAFRRGFGVVVGRERFPDALHNDYCRDRWFVRIAKEVVHLPPQYGPSVLDNHHICEPQETFAGVQQLCC